MIYSLIRLISHAFMTHQRSWVIFNWRRFSTWLNLITLYQC